MLYQIVTTISEEYDLIRLNELNYCEPAVAWLKYCPYGIRHKTILRTICSGVDFVQTLSTLVGLEVGRKIWNKKTKHCKTSLKYVFISHNLTTGIENTQRVGWKSHPTPKHERSYIYLCKFFSTDAFKMEMYWSVVLPFYMKADWQKHNRNTI